MESDIERMECGKVGCDEAALRFDPRKWPVFEIFDNYRNDPG
jgi:hypothetical protein